jgi:hypothetical protein
MIKFTVLAGASLLAVLAMTAAPPALAGTLYSQPSDGTACAPSCWTSTDGAGAPITGGYQTFDDFSLSSKATVTQVSWYGFYMNSDGGPNPATPTTTSWQLGFYANSGTLPGAALYSTTLADSSVTAAFLGDVSGLGETVPFYKFTANLPTGFSASASTTYWFSALSEQPTFEPFFSWSPSNIGDGSAELDLPGSANGDANLLYSVADNRAFILSGTSAVPEPGAWALMLLGVGGAGAGLRIARHRKDTELSAA